MIRTRRLAALAWAILALACTGSLAAPASPTQALDIAYPGTRAPNDQRVGYYIKLLDLALSKTGVAYRLHPNSTPMVSPRVREELEANNDINVTWGPTTKAYEDTLLPVRIPIDKGILGWRLLLIRAGNRDAFAAVNTLEQLQQYLAGQQRYWSDADILRANGLTVVESTRYTTLFDMLAANRFQYFPRGVGEIWHEQENYANLGLVVESHIALHYPSNSYYFVSRKNPELAALIDKGLRTAIKDGSFDRLFAQYNGDALKRAHLATRTVFELHDPDLPETGPVLNDEHPLRP